MSTQKGYLIAGLGSTHGDDQAGWRVIDQLAAKVNSDVRCAKATVPHDILDWMTGIDSLHLVDACQPDASQPDACQSLESVVRVSASQPSVDLHWNSRSLGSHQLEIVTVLQLAEALNLLPRCVTLWGVPGQSFQPNGSLSDRCAIGVRCCAEQIRQEVGGA